MMLTPQTPEKKNHTQVYDSDSAEHFPTAEWVYINPTLSCGGGGHVVIQRMVFAQMSLWTSVTQRGRRVMLTEKYVNVYLTIPSSSTSLLKIIKSYGNICFNYWNFFFPNVYFCSKLNANVSCDNLN